MNVVDSSCWLEYFAGSVVGELVSEAIENTNELLVPTICLYEVFKKLLVETDEDSALFAVAQMKQGTIVELDPASAIYAAKVGKHYRLAMADSIIYTCAILHKATVWTQDKHFKDLHSVKYFPKTD